MRSATVLILFLLSSCGTQIGGGTNVQPADAGIAPKESCPGLSNSNVTYYGNCCPAANNGCSCIYQLSTDANQNTTESVTCHA